MVLGETHKSAKSVIEAFHGANIAILVQEFIKEAEGRDIRVIVVGGKPVAAMSARAPRAISAPTCIAAAVPRRSTITQGRARHRHSAPPSPWASMSAASTCCAPTRGPVVMEVNSSPGLEGIEKATGVDVAAAIIEFLEAERAARAAPAPRASG